VITLDAPLDGVTPIPLGPLPGDAGPLTILGYRNDRPHIATRAQRLAG